MRNTKYIGLDLGNARVSRHTGVKCRCEQVSSRCPGCGDKDLQCKFPHANPPSICAPSLLYDAWRSLVSSTNYHKRREFTTREFRRELGGSEARCPEKVGGGGTKHSSPECRKDKIWRKEASESESESMEEEHKQELMDVG